MAIASISVSETPLVLYVLRRADDALILGHRLSEWCGHAPMLEEDMAAGQYGPRSARPGARNFIRMRLMSKARTTTRTNSRTCATSGSIANLLLLEQPERRFRAHRWCGSFFTQASPTSIGAPMMTSGDATLAAIAAKSEKESAYHLRHSSEWIVRLGDGTEESHRRAQTGDRRISGLLRARCSKLTTASGLDRCRHRG